MQIPARTSYLLKRLHSLTGVVPVGLFLLWHLLANSYAMHGPRAFNGIAGFLAGLPYVQLIEFFGIAVPILFHMALGVIIITTGQANLGRYRTPDNWRYLLQRLSGLVLVAYVIYHTWTTRLSPEVLARRRGPLHADGATAWPTPGCSPSTCSAWSRPRGTSATACSASRSTGASPPGAARSAPWPGVGYAVFLVLSLVGVNSLLAFRHGHVRIFERVPAAADALTLTRIPDAPGGAR